MVQEIIALVCDCVYKTRKLKAKNSVKISVKLKYEIFLQWVTKFLFRKFWGYDAVIATFKDLLNMAFTEKRLNKT